MEFYMTKSLFLCGSKYTLFNCINLANSVEFQNSICDIIVFCDKGLEKVAENLSKVGIFRKVIKADFVNNYSLIKKIKLFLVPKAFKEKETLQEDNYDRLIVQSLFYASLVSRRINYKEIYLIEEGLSTYTSRVYSSKKRSIFFNLFNAIFMRKNTVHVNGCYVYNSKLMVSNDIKTKDLPQISKETDEILKKVFMYTRKDKSVRYITFLGSPYYGIRDLLENPKLASRQFEDCCDEIVKKILGSCGKSIIYRKHPRENISYEGTFDNLTIDSNDNIWELISEDEITNDSIIISFFSTAAFTPKILYNTEPYVIFLYGILNEKVFNADLLVQGLKGSYKNSSKVLIPKTIDEAINMMRKLTDV